MAKLLNENERDLHLPKLLNSGWQIVEGRDAIEKSIKCKNFVEAFGLMTKIAIQAEKMDHHPEWSNVYSKLDILLTTHSCNGLSMLDIKLAEKIDQFTEK